MARTLAQIDAALASLEARFPAPVEDSAPYVEVVTASVTVGDKVITSTAATTADLEAEVAAKITPAGKE